MSEAIYYDGWHTCATCGADKGGMDLWQDTCPRCAELAALEREIGRAVIGHKILANTPIYDEDTRTVPYLASRLRESINYNITRYRALLAAGAEAATGGEEA